MSRQRHRDTTHQERLINIFVGNLHWETTEDEIEQLFAPYGGELER
jgi:RNA recognition motif-containing protein